MLHVDILGNNLAIVVYSAIGQNRTEYVTIPVQAVCSFDVVCSLLLKRTSCLGEKCFDIGCQRQCCHSRSASRSIQCIDQQRRVPSQHSLSRI